MYDAEDYRLLTFFGIIAFALLIICSAGAYAIVKQANKQTIQKSSKHTK